MEWVRTETGFINLHFCREIIPTEDGIQLVMGNGEVKTVQTFNRTIVAQIDDDLCRMSKGESRWD